MTQLNISNISSLWVYWHVIKALQCGISKQLPARQVQKALHWIIYSLLLANTICVYAVNMLMWLNACKVYFIHHMTELLWQKSIHSLLVTAMLSVRRLDCGAYRFSSACDWIILRIAFLFRKMRTSVLLLTCFFPLWTLGSFSVCIFSFACVKFTFQYWFWYSFNHVKDLKSPPVCIKFMVRHWQHIPERKAYGRLWHDYRAVTCKVRFASVGCSMWEQVLFQSYFWYDWYIVHISWLWFCVLLPLNCLHYPNDWADWTQLSLWKGMVVPGGGLGFTVVL